VVTYETENFKKFLAFVNLCGWLQQLNFMNIFDFAKRLFQRLKRFICVSDAVTCRLLILHRRSCLK